MKLKLFFPILVLLSALLMPSTAWADGIIVPPMPCMDCPPPPCPGPFSCPPPSPMQQLVIRYHRVTVEIQDQVAVTHVDQVFYNPNDWQVEGTYLFPLPADAAVSGFTLWVDGKPVEGEILDADQARRNYQEIVATLRDPALLEYAGQGAFQAHIFPIPPDGERRIELEYSQALAAEGGLVRYVYPLNTEKFSAWPIENVSVNVSIESEAPIRAVYSPSHEIAVDRADDHHARAGYEAADVLPDSDFALYYSIGENQALHLMTYRDPDSEDADGFFLLLLAPQPDVPTTNFAKDVLLVLDRSGSMDGDKFAQAQDALRYVLGHLNPEDRFNMIAFSTGMEQYGSGLRPASEASEALSWVDRLSAEGSTDINRALLEAAAMVKPGRPTYLIFLTDGLPTEGVVDSQQILSNLQVEAPENLRLFAFGVGYDVDTFLLDSLAKEHHGASSYVLPGEPLDEAISGFYAKISTPVLTDLSLDFGSIPVYDLYPSPLPDLFKGSQIVVVGRYRQGGEADLTLQGEVNGEPQAFTFEGQEFPSRTALTGPQAAIPRLWATRKIGHLLNQVRLHVSDQETIDQIVRLSIRYGIVTPYTSYLVTEESAPLGQAAQDRIAAEELEQMLEAPAEPSYGQEAVEKAVDQGNLAGAGAPAPVSPAGQARGEGANSVRVVGSKTFVQVDDRWIDTAFDPDRMQTTKVSFLSEDYFALTASRPDLAAAFALGEQVIALSGGVAYEVVPADTAVAPLDLPVASTPAVPQTQQPVAPTQIEPPVEVTPVANLPANASQPETSRPAAGPCASGLLILAFPIGAVQFRRLAFRS